MSVSKREVDISIAVERPTEERLFARKLVDYELRIYAVRDYREAHSPIETPGDLSRQTWIGYGNEFMPTAKLGPLSRGDWGTHASNHVLKLGWATHGYVEWGGN